MAVVTTEQSVAALYTAIFNRAPDQAGLTFWTDRINAGASFADVAAGFAQHEVFTTGIGALSDADYVNALYTNILGSAGDAAGITYWIARLASGESKASVVASFVEGSLTIDLNAMLADGSLSQADFDLALIRQQTLTNKSDAGIYFAETLGVESNLAAGTDITSKAGLEADPIYKASQAAIAGVTQTAASVGAAKTNIDAAAASSDPAQYLLAIAVVVHSLTGANSITLAANPTTVVVKLGQDKQALADKAAADDAAYSAAQAISDAALTTAELTDADALKVISDANADAAGLTDAAALKLVSDTDAEAAGLTDAVALKLVSDTDAEAAGLTDAVALKLVSDTDAEAAGLTDAVALKLVSDADAVTAAETDAAALKLVSDADAVTAAETDAEALKLVSDADAVTAAETDAEALKATSDADEQAWIASGSAESGTEYDTYRTSLAATQAAQLADSNVVTSLAATTAAELADSKAVNSTAATLAAQQADTKADSSAAATLAAQQADTKADNSAAATLAAQQADTKAVNSAAATEAAELADANYATSLAATNAAVTADNTAASTLAATNAAVAADTAYATALTVTNTAQILAAQTDATALQLAAKADATSFSSLEAMDVITGFTVGTDKISLLTATGAAVTQPATLTHATDIVTSDNLTASLTAAFSGTAANAASLVVIEAGTAEGTYLYVNDADGAFSASADVFIKLVGVTPAVGELAVGDYFA